MARTPAKKRTIAKTNAAPPKKRAPRPKINEELACYRMRLDRSKIHRWGVYADEPIPALKKVIEYTGERIGKKETDIRAARPLNYIFTLDDEYSIDGSVGGSGAQFINHCCEPNLTARILKGHILYFAIRRIRKGEELTIDYHFGHDEETVECQCGSKKCRGTINLLE